MNTILLVLGWLMAFMGVTAVSASMVALSMAYGNPWLLLASCGAAGGLICWFASKLLPVMDEPYQRRIKGENK